MSVQLEDGYTRIANELLENLPKYKFNGTQLRIIMVIWRFTYGFKRKDHEMSLSFFTKATGLGKTQIDRELTNLIELKVIAVTEESTYTKARKLGFNKNYIDWMIEYSQQISVESAKTLTVSKNAEEQSAEMRTPTVSKNADQERKVLKDNLKERVLPLINFHKINYEKDEQINFVESYLNVMDFEVMEDSVIRSNGRHINYLLKILKNLVSECKTSKSTLTPRFIPSSEQEAINALRRAEELKNQPILNYEPEYVGVGNGTVPAGSN